MPRVCGQSGEPNQRSGDGNECFEPDIEFVIAGSDAAKLLQARKESFDEIATFVEMFVIAPRFLSIRSRRNDGRGLHRLNAVKEAGGIKGFIGNNGTDVLHAFDKIGGLGNVVALAAGQSKPS